MRALGEVHVCVRARAWGGDGWPLVCVSGTLLWCLAVLGGTLRSSAPAEAIGPWFCWPGP
eukprot:5083427-Alexandrium_andersonii.AAC.1